jgi:hypothetical protein
MAQRNGFDVIAVEHTANNEYITAFIKRSKTPSEFARTLQTSFANYKNDFIGFFDKLKHKKVALWGAGAKGISLFSWTDIDSGYIQYCVDSDPNKWGKYLPGSHIQVVSPTHLKENPVDYVIVTAMMYRDEIIYAVKKFGYSEKRIAIIAPSPKFLV